jgi:hypothetical protein
MVLTNIQRRSLQRAGKFTAKNYIQNTSFSSWLTNGPNKLECLSLASISRLVQHNTSLLGTFISYEGDEARKNFYPWIL